jgi:hypothetical protein
MWTEDEIVKLKGYAKEGRLQELSDLLEDKERESYDKGNEFVLLEYGGVELLSENSPLQLL